MYKYHITLFWNFMNHLIPFSHHFCIFYYYKLNQNALLKQEANLPPWVNDMIFEQLIKLSTCLISHFSQDQFNTLERLFFKFSCFLRVANIAQPRKLYLSKIAPKFFSQRLGNLFSLKIILGPLERFWKNPDIFICQ